MVGNAVPTVGPASPARPSPWPPLPRVWGAPAAGRAVVAVRRTLARFFKGETVADEDSGGSRAAPGPRLPPPILGAREACSVGAL